MANLLILNRRFEHCACKTLSAHDVWYDMVTWVYQRKHTVNFY